VILLLDETGGLRLGELIGNWWPALLIIAGVSLLTGRGRFHLSRPLPADARENVQGDRLSQSNVAGDVALTSSSGAFAGGTVTAVFGDVTIDCHAASFAPGEARLNISSVFGDADLRVPPGSAVRVTAHTLFGDATVFDVQRGGISAHLVYETPGYAAAPARLLVEMSQVFGDIDVRS
jgi:predicted membrane protein